MNHDHNFDNVGVAMLSLYVVSSLEGWPDILYVSMDITTKTFGPK